MQQSDVVTSRQPIHTTKTPPGRSEGVIHPVKNAFTWKIEISTRHAFMLMLKYLSINMLYIADLGRDGLIKVGIAEWYRLNRRQAELRRTLKAPKLVIRLETAVPNGWGSEREWEKALLENSRAYCGNLQFNTGGEDNTELVEASYKDVIRELSLLRAKTEIDHSKDADQISVHKEDWRFFNFMIHHYPKTARDVKCGDTRFWKNSITRQVFINALRGDVYAPMPQRFLSNSEPLPHLIVNMTGSPTQTHVQAPPDAALPIVRHPISDPKLNLNGQLGFARPQLGTLFYTYANES